MATSVRASPLSGVACSARRSTAGIVTPVRSVSSAPPSRRSAVAVQAFFNFGKPKAPPPPPKVVRPTVVVDPSFNLQLGLLAIAGGAGYEGWWPVAGFFGFLGVFLTYQATQLKFSFDDEAFEIYRAGKETDNVIVGGRNRWTYDSFTNWCFWWPSFPILVYFKENQTKPEGQVHFFPIIFNGKQLFEVMEERCGPRNQGF